MLWEQAAGGRNFPDTVARNLARILAVIAGILQEGAEKGVFYVQSLEYEEVFMGKAWSLTTILKEINQVLNENQPSYCAIPDNRDLIAQEFLLFENSGSDDLEDFVDSQFAMARFTVLTILSFEPSAYSPPTANSSAPA